MTADGSIIIDTRINTDGMQDGVNNIGGIFNGLGSKVKKLGLAIGAAFAVKKVIDFGKECLELGSDLQEVQNVVDSVFTTMSDQVDQFAQSAVQSAGLSETMAKKYAGNFGAMAKSFGFAESEAYDMATSLTQLSGDVASFYNLSQDEAYTKLKSVFTGETESLKELGVVMTQSALDSYAMANGFGKTTSAMTEQEKVALRYQFVMSQLSTASGDFLRTSDGWANQVRVLKLQIESLKATIGQGLINILTPVIKVINTLLAKLATVANAFKSFTELVTGKKSSGATSASSAGLTADEYDAVASGAENLANATSDVADATKKAQKANKGYLSGLDEIKRWSSDTTAEQTGSSSTPSAGTAAGATAAVIPVDYGQAAEGNTILDDMDSKLMKLFNTLKEYVKPLSEQLSRFGGIVKDAFGWLLNNVLKPLANWTVNEALPRFFQTLANVMEIVNEVLIALQPLWDWFWTNVLKPIATWAADKFLSAWDAINAALKKFADWCRENPETIQNITLAVAAFFAAFKVASAISGIIEFIKTLGGLGGIIKSVGAMVAPLFSNPIVLAIAAVVAAGVLIWKNWDEIKEKGKKIWDWISSYLKRTWETIKKNASDIWNKIKNFFEKLWNGLKSIAKTVFDGIKSVISIVWNGIKSAASTVWNGIKNTLSKIWNGIKSAASTVFNGIKNVVSTSWNNIKSVTSTVWNGIKGVASNAWNGLKSTASNTFSNIKNTVSNAWNSAKSLTSSAWSGIKSTLSGAWDGIKSKASSAFGGIKSTVSNAWSGVKSESSSVWSGISGVIVNSIRNIGTSAGQMGSTVKSAFYSAFNGLVSIIKSPVNGVIGFINRMISGVVSGINTILKAFNKLRINIPSWVPVYGGKRLGFNFSMLRAPQIPYLAKGAVIPPNAPFTAVLGDQRHGTNIETPEALLRQIMREELVAQNKQAGGGSYRFTAQINRRTLFDEFIAEAKARRDQTGRNPLEFA